MLCATFDAPPSRTCSDWNCTTGTGASGEMRVTRPTMKRSSITSPMTRTRTPAKRASRSDARAGVSSGSVTSGSPDGPHLWRAGVPNRGGGQRDDDQEEHLHFGIAEVVFEESGGQQRGDRREAGCRKKTVGPRLVPQPQGPRKGDDEPEPQ